VGGRKLDLIIPVVLLEDGEFSENAGTPDSDLCNRYGCTTFN